MPPAWRADDPRNSNQAISPGCWRYERILTQGLAWHETLPPLPRPAGARGNPRRRAEHNLLLRLGEHRQDVLRFLTNPDVPFSTNQAERDIRMMKLRQKISGCFCTRDGAQTFTTLRTVLSTAIKQGWNIFDTITGNPQTLKQKLRTA
jgi:transposase